MKDEASFTRITDQLKRKKDRKLDITQQGLESGGIAMLGIALRAVAYGAAQGLGQWGDPRAVAPLTDLIEDETWHEEARLAACEALAFCADDRTMAEVARKAKDFAGRTEKGKRVIGACYAAALQVRPVPAAAPVLAELLAPGVEIGVRTAFARALGMSGFDAATEARLFEKLSDPETRDAAALALVLGGSADTAARAVARYADVGKDALAGLQDLYYVAFGYLSDEDLQQGRLYRWVDNALAIGHVEVHDARQDWARRRLEGQLDNLRFDNGPHSLTRAVLRRRLFDAARGGDPATKRGALQTLELMKEKGVLMALRRGR
jgi:phosphoglycolate phosphatase-like HAD superfamily hydrolase